MQKYKEIYKYKYTYKRTVNYCYKDTDGLINLLNIKDDKILYDEKRNLVSLRIYTLNEKHLEEKNDLNNMDEYWQYWVL